MAQLATCTRRWIPPFSIVRPVVLIACVVLDGLLDALCEESGHADETVLPAVVRLVAQPECLVCDPDDVHVRERLDEVLPVVDFAGSPGAIGTLHPG